MSSPSRIQSVRLNGSAVVEDALGVVGGRGDGERRAGEAVVRRVGEQLHAALRDRLTDPGAATALAEDRLALVGDPRSRRPVRVDGQVGHRGGRQNRVVATSLQVHPAVAPRQPLGEGGVHRGGIDVREVPRCATHPGTLAQVGRLAGAAVVTGRLDVPAPQPGAGADVRRGDLVVDEAVEDPTLCLGLRERLTQSGRERVVDRDRGGFRRGRPVGIGVAGHQVVGVLRCRARPSSGIRLLDEGAHLIGGSRAAGHGADRDPVVLAGERDDRDGHPVHLAVRGQGVVGPAQVGAGGVVGDRDAVVGGGGRQRVLDQVLRSGSGHDQWPASSVVLRIRTSRNSEVGHPWLTDATWPGWALPQLKAPPSTQVSGPPTASIEFQNSVVVAW